MELVSIFKRVIGLDVHQAQVTACAIIEAPDGQVIVEQRQFGAFKKDRRALAEWCAALRPEEVVMESTGIYWKSPYAALEAAGIRAKVVNARHCPSRSRDARPTSATPNGWQCWPVPACCVAPSCRWPNCASCA